MTPTEQWITTIRELASRAGCSAAVLPELDRVEHEIAESITVAIVGAPNSGKSSVLNALVECEVARVTPIPTRIEVRVRALDDDESHTDTLDAVLTSTDDDVEARESLLRAIRNEWMRAREIRLVEKPGLDATEDESAAAIADAIDRADIVLVVIDATMPIRRIEPLLLQEAHRRGLPIIVAVAKRDALLDDRERQSVRIYVQRYIDLAAPAAAVIDMPMAAGDVTALRAAIDIAVDGLDRDESRARATRHVLNRLAQSVAAAAETGRAASAKSEADRAAEVISRRRELDGEFFRWTDLELELEQRRQRLEKDVALQVAAQRPLLVDVLEHEVERSNDLRAWWERDLPFLLRRELRQSSAAVADHVNRVMTSDFQSLQEQLSVRGGDSTASVPEAHIEPVADSEIRRPKPPLADTNKLRMILGASASVALILAARYLDRARIPMVSLAFAIIGGPAAEQILSHRTDKDRQLVKQQLTRVVTECDADYLRAVTGKLKIAYADALRTLRACRDQWRAAELESLVSVTATEAPPGSQHWDGILRDARALVNQLGGHTP